MGYHLTIIRTKGRKSLSITREEFISAAGKVPELRLEPAKDVAQLIREGELRATLKWQDGEVWTKVPEPEVIAVMLALAGRLGARVRGDEMETYRSPDETYVHPDDAEAIGRREAEELLQTRKRKWRRITWDLVRIAVVIFIAIRIIQHLSQ